MGFADKALDATFHSIMPRTAGFNSLDVGAFRDETLMANYGLMFIGRIDTITVATAVALGSSKRLYRYPEEKPILG